MAVLGFFLYAVVIVAMMFLNFTALYQLFLVLAYRRHRGDDPAPKNEYKPAEYPKVTVQLPVYNEGRLAEQILRLAANIDYPADKLQVQYIDDSDDGETTELALKTLEALKLSHPDIDFQYLRRLDRTGFKAGALKLGTERASGELLAIFDADFIIPTDYLQRTVHYFTDPKVGIVQARWDYTNENHSLFTRLQANKLDAHQMFEQTARDRMGLVAIFHGTAGMWRKEALDAAGGWTCISEVEDLEATIRASELGWQLVYLDHLRVPSELPENVNGYLRQQMRWRRGWVRVIRHYSGTILRGNLDLKVRLDLVMRIFQAWGSIAALIATLGVLPGFMYAKQNGLLGFTVAVYSLSLVMGLTLRHFETKTLGEDRHAREPMKVHPFIGLLPLNYLLFSLGTLWPMTQSTLEGFGKVQTWEVTPKSGTTDGSSGHTANNRQRVPIYVYGTLGLSVVSAILALLSLLQLNVLPTLFYGFLSVGCGLIGLMLLQFFGYKNRLTAKLLSAFVE
ncbi:glycosyltransferase [Algirhabdus cladophorae]|uniref:glycosyltransferase n=1 Tax=Algirhabdus cladophorae TaxID=3377108 RepID=UPI003B847A65